MSTEPPVPETRVLAIASHVTHGYVGNTMAVFVMQALGCEVSAINTVNYSNHTAYKQVKGTKTSAEQILDLYEGLRQSELNDFDVLLSGYIPSAAGVEAVGKIGRDLKFNASTRPGSFFWVLDPVMGDNGKLYIPEDEVPQYKNLLKEAHLILPNQTEAELLADSKITDLHTLASAVKTLHRSYQIPHIIITSLRLSADNHTLPSRPPSPSTFNNPEHEPEKLTIIGSTATWNHEPRLFRIDVPALPIFFSGTGDMFAALIVARLREAAAAAGTLHVNAWVSPDAVAPADLPLAKAVEKVLASMQAVLHKTAERALAAFQAIDAEEARAGRTSGEEGDRERALRRHLKRTKASEVMVVRNVADLIHPPDLERFRATTVELSRPPSAGAGEPTADGLGVVHLGAGGQGAVHYPHSA